MDRERERERERETDRDGETKSETNLFYYPTDIFIILLYINNRWKPVVTKVHNIEKHSVPLGFQ